MSSNDSKRIKPVNIQQNRPDDYRHSAHFSSSLRSEKSRPGSSSHSADSQRSTGTQAWRILRAQEDSPPGSCNGFVLCGIPYRGQGRCFRYLVQPYEPASLFPPGAGRIGHREAPLLICNFLRIAQAIPSCKSRKLLISLTVSRLFENTNRSAFLQLT